MRKRIEEKLRIIRIKIIVSSNTEFYRVGSIRNIIKKIWRTTREKIKFK